MKGQRVTRKLTPARLSTRPSSGLKTLTTSLFIAVALLMTGSTAFLYKKGIDPVEFYSNLANPYMKFVTIPAGLRREQIAEKFAQVLSWNQSDITDFIKTAPSDDRGLLDGYYLPGSYWVKTTATGADVAHQMLRNFNTQVSEKILAKGNASITSNNTALSTTSTGNVKSSSKIPQKPLTKEQKINLDTAVRIAAIIQKEAAGPVDMKLISGVIWNRIFKGMTLDMDATLQYAKANQLANMASASVSGSSTFDWWPNPESKDKFIDSPFNTYENKGLTPIAIANPSIDAISAAYNPTKTDCLFYLHDTNGKIHCTKTYQAHKDNVQKYLVGQR